MNADREVDLLVVGAGPAGMAAALIASLEGLDVLLCEKSDQVGGTGATSAGTLWIPGNSESKAAGYKDSAEAAEKYLDALIGHSTNRELRTVYLKTGPVAIDYLSAKTDVKFLACGKHPDYRSNMPGAAITGRAIIPQPFDGRLLGKDFRRVRSPIPEFMVFGGMMVGKADIPPLIGRFKSVANFIYSAKLFARYLADRLKYPRGTRVMMGNALIGRLFYSLKKRKVPILFDTTITDFLGDRHGVSGARIVFVTAETLWSRPAGASCWRRAATHTTRASARRSCANPVPKHSMSHAGNSGDGISIGQQIGARIAPEEHGNSGLWTPVSIVTRADGSEGLYPHLVLDRAKPGLIAVNSVGRRFVNEAASYHDFAEGMLESHKNVPSIPAYLICDAPFIKQYGLGLVYPGSEAISHGWSAPAICSEATRWTSWAARFRLMRLHCAKRSRATIDLRKPASTSISAKARPNSIASTAIQTTNPIRVLVGSRPRHFMRSRSGRRTSPSALGCRPIVMRAC